MFEKWRIKEHMEVADASGQHIGTVDSVDDGRIKLTRSDSADASHHYIDLDLVERIDDNRVYIKAGGTAEQSGGYEGAHASTGASESGGENAGEGKLFGTSGHGTGMGGSGVS